MSHDHDIARFSTTINKSTNQDQHSNNQPEHSTDQTKHPNNQLEPSINEAHKAYVENVKTPFLKALKLFALSPEQPIENQLEEKLQQLANSIN
ncbi:hypothetical protein H6G06_02600 [Anabaena sphaerica FACHB-251]|uniref:Uncharacterized protein n=1 Tax=Anabaena sphaerica FACHB-251 TaxID=2692883 RepID=A0A926ZZ89_9NOST|nr:hypothetical protein [Anabaena sphaerica]MBD2292399.1 hypothetical protein [Anabaena sphaerica FACHB-251]